jgi:hypothetical protein
LPEQKVLKGAPSGEGVAIKVSFIMSQNHLRINKKLQLLSVRRPAEREKRRIGGLLLLLHLL